MKETETSEIMHRQPGVSGTQSCDPQRSNRTGLRHGVDSAGPGRHALRRLRCESGVLAGYGDRVNHFEVEDTVVMGDRANIRWRFHFGDGGSVRGVSLVRVHDGRIVEALAYAKVPGESAPLPE